MSERERVEQVMQALGSAEMPAGMEARVLARVTAARAQSRSAGLGWFWGAAVAAGLLVMVGVGVHGHARVKAPVVAANAAGTREEIPQEPRPAEIRGADFTKKSVGLERSRRVRVRRSERPAVESFPAPPEPLTEQEKLLLKVARNGDRNNDFALLDPERIEVAFAKEDAEMAEMARKGRLAPMK